MTPLTITSIESDTMDYYLQSKNQLILGLIAILAGLLLVLFSGTGGIFVGLGILMIVIHFYQKSNPVLSLEDDHLVYNPALLRSKKFVKREDVLSVEEAEKGWFNTDVYRITTDTEGELDIYKGAFDDSVKASFVDDVSDWIGDDQLGTDGSTRDDASRVRLMDEASG